MFNKTLNKFTKTRWINSLSLEIVGVGDTEEEASEDLKRKRNLVKRRDFLMPVNRTKGGKTTRMLMRPDMWVSYLSPEQRQEFIKKLAEEEAKNGGLV